MSIQNKKIITIITLVVLLTLGLWSIQQGKVAFGTSLMGASIGAWVMRYLKDKRMAELRARGLEPQDERTMHIAGLASMLTMNITILVIALSVLVGSVFGPVITVNPYDLLGFCLAGIVSLYIFAFYHYDRLN